MEKHETITTPLKTREKFKLDSLQGLFVFVFEKYVFVLN